jgi:DNA polymerase III delta prime subunit
MVKRRRVDDMAVNPTPPMEEDGNSVEKPDIEEDGNSVEKPDMEEDEMAKSSERKEEECEEEEEDSDDEECEEEEEDSDDEEDDNFDIERELEKLKETYPKAHANLQAVKNEIARTEPDVKKLLLTPMRLEDRAKLCQYYEIYKMHVPNTNEWLECRTRYNDMFKEYKAGYEQSRKYSEEDIARMKEEEEKFTGFDAQLALKYKILNLETSKENKEVIYRRYEEFLSLDTTDDEFGKLKHWLTWATDFPHDRVKEIEVDNVTEFIKRAKTKLDNELYGMDKVKEQILLFLSAKLRNPHMVHANLGLVGPPGVGKCLARGTPIVMYDGTIKEVQDIQVGDLLMGDDSTPRNVLSLARGRERMYKIHQTKGNDYTVNESHILSLKVTKMAKKNTHMHINGKAYRKDDIVDISVKDYIELPNGKKASLKGFKVGVDFPERNVPFDPYIIGLWLGDGSSSTSNITNQDARIIHYLHQTLPKQGMCLQHQREYDYKINGTKQVNPFWNTLKELNLVNNKHIPHVYYCNSRKIRLRLLAGFLDSDRYYAKHANTFEITQKNTVLAHSIVMLCRSLGFYVSTKMCKKSYMYKGVNCEDAYQRILISGSGLEEIPVLIERKKGQERQQIQNALHTCITLEPLPVNDYYGFTIDGNHRFLLGDFTVTHNTHVARLIAEIMDWGFAQISFGGVDKADFLKGHEYTYVGAQPGEIVKCLKRMGHKNGVIFLDELDKIAENPEIRSALLHMIDPTQNKDYRDNFLGGEISIDLSRIWYIGSMNSVPADEALADRWWIINVEGYNNHDKVKIIEKYLVPRAVKNCGMVENSVVFHSGEASHLITTVCGHTDKGVRTLEKSIKDMINKINFLVTHQDEQGKLPFKTSFELNRRLEFPVMVTRELLDKLLESKELDTMLRMMYI